MRRTLRVLLLASIAANAAHATPFGTRSTAAIDLPGDAYDGFAEEQTVDLPVSTSSTWITDGVTTAGAITPFAESHAFAASAPGTQAFAASLWADTWTLASASGAGGSTSIELHLRLAGALDAGAHAGGFVQLALHALLGEPGDALAPGVLFAGGSVVVDAACDALPCEGVPQDVDEALVVHAVVPYDAPFRFALLLEAIAWGGAATAGESSAWLTRIALPSGAQLSAASGASWSHAIVAAPEPGTLLLCAAGLAALASRRRRA